MARKKKRLLEKLPELRQMVKDHGGIEKAEWKAMSKAAGLTERECLEYFKWAFVPTREKAHWTREEEGRLAQSLRSQRQHWFGFYRWDTVAADVKTHTAKQCRRKFYFSTEIRKVVEQPLHDTLPGLSEE
ncbi:hypothetical protein IWW48_006101 [Coemansia sp. RSA 1200]|nr:hypothetical protein IWW48_006101 [Coemansia sp. RSA 1200]